MGLLSLMRMGGTHPTTDAGFSFFVLHTDGDMKTWKLLPVRGLLAKPLLRHEDERHPKEIGEKLDDLSIVTEGREAMLN